jgi:hypothetical protein
MSPRLLGRAGLLCLALAGSLVACGRTQGTPMPNTRDGGADAGLDAGTEGDDAGTGVPDAGPPPELKILRVLPPRGSSAGLTQVVIEGSGFLHGVAERGSDAKKVTTLKFGSNPSLDFQILDEETIDARVPQGKAGLVKVTLENTNGRFVCSGCFSYYDDLFVSALTPKDGPLRGGNEVTLTGGGFTTDVQVHFGARTSTKVTRVSATELKVTVPAGAVADLVDLTVFNKNGLSSLRRIYRYVADTKVTGLSPLAGPLGGGTTVVMKGEGFDGATSVTVGAVAATGLAVASGTQLSFVTPAGSVAGAVDIRVTTPRDQRIVRGGFTYLSAPGALTLDAAFPHVGPAAGGNTIRVTGVGLDEGGLTFSIGGTVAPHSVQSANEVTLTVPARTGARVVPIAVTDGSTSSTLVTGYTYGMTLGAPSPVNGPLAGGTVATSAGTGLSPDLLLFVCGVPATVGSVTETSLTFTTPAGSGGEVCPLRAVSASDPENEVTVLSAFTYHEPLLIGRVQPDKGAIAGGALVTVLGTGFGDSTIVRFGDGVAKDVKVLDPHTLTCRIPRGNSGSVTVEVAKPSAKDSLPGGFAYFDPRNSAGGLSGGSLVGTINVTVLDSTPGFSGQSVPLASVMLGVDAATPFQGVTDARGQLTFSDSSLVKAQTVTAFKEGYESVTVSNVIAENLTVYMARTSGEGEPGQPPPGPPPAQISGKVYGFKTPRALSPDEVMEVRVFLAQGSLFSGAPFTSPYPGQNKWVVTKEGGDYLLLTLSGLRAAYAVLGVKNLSSQDFTPYLMGVRRGITASSDRPALNEDIVLDMHLDMTVPVTVDGPLTLDGSPAINNLYAWLDLGAEGFIPNPNNWATGTSNQSAVSSPDVTLSFPNFPRLDGSNFVFMNQATSVSGTGTSHFFRRQPGDLTAGMRVGPMLPAPSFATPTQVTGFTGQVRWTVDPGTTPDIHQVLIVKPSLVGLMTVWSVILPGSDTQVTLPPLVVQKLRTEEAGNTLYVLIYSSRSPKFNYAQWSYDTLSGVSWSSFTSALSDGFMP